MPVSSPLNFSDLANELKTNVQQEKNSIDNTLKLISQKDKDLRDKIKRSLQQNMEISYKQKLINTRNRMLQLSQEKNMYKTKIIYTLLSVVILLVIILLAIYVYFSK
jgi:tetrahydromethanopterin S-methyltransferase subunit F